jgi:hypothetical protein
MIRRINSSPSRRQMAAARARVRDMLYFYGAFASLAFPALIARARATKNPMFLGPVVIISFVLAYQVDMAYGNKLERIRDDAERMLRDEPELFALPLAADLNVTALDRLVAASLGEKEPAAMEHGQRD